MARKSVVELTVKDVIASGNQAAETKQQSGSRTGPPKGWSNPVTGSALRMT
jgi:hypothetical protein